MKKKKKNLLNNIGVLAITTIIVFNININVSDKDSSLLYLANVEALAAESDNNVTHTLECESKGIKMCKATCDKHNVTLEKYGSGKTSVFTCRE